MPEAGDNRSLKTIAVIGAVGAIAVVVAGLALRHQSDRTLAGWTREQVVPTVSVIHAAPAAATGGGLQLPAKLEALNSAPIFARTSGYVRRWYVDIGDAVRTGQTLAVLDAPELDQQLAAARANLQTALANQRLAATTATRWRTMLAKDAVSRQETDEKIGDAAAKAAVVNAARAEVSRLRYTQGFTRLAAPFPGIVTSRNAQIGELVQAGTSGSTPLFTVSDVSRIRVFVRVPQAASARIHPGLRARLALPEYPGRSFDAVLVRSAGAVDPSSGTVLTELVAENRERALKPGAYATASFDLPGVSGAVSLPATALIVGEGGSQVAVMGPDRRVRLRKVAIARDLGDTIEIGAGLSTADWVIDNPPDTLQPGDEVRPRRGGAGDARG